MPSSHGIMVRIIMDIAMVFVPIQELSIFCYSRLLIVIFVYAIQLQSFILVCLR